MHASNTAKRHREGLSPTRNVPEFRPHESASQRATWLKKAVTEEAAAPDTGHENDSSASSDGEGTSTPRRVLQNRVTDSHRRPASCSRLPKARARSSKRPPQPPPCTQPSPTAGEERGRTRPAASRACTSPKHPPTAAGLPASTLPASRTHTESVGRAAGENPPTA